MTVLHWREGAGLGRRGRTPSVSRRQGKFWLSLDERDIWWVVHGTRRERIRSLSWHLGHPLTLQGNSYFSLVFQPGSW